MNKLNWLNHFLNFVSVILGVSLAFFLNDYAIDKQLAQKQHLFLNALYEEIDRDIQVYDTYQIQRNQLQVETLNFCIQSLQERTNSDSVLSVISQAIGYRNYQPSKVAFESISQSGNYELIRDFELSRDLINYYNVLGEEAKLRGIEQINFYQGEVLRWMLDNTNVSSTRAEDLYSAAFINRLIVYRSLVKNKIAQYERLVTQGEKLKLKVETELAKY